MQNFGQQIKAVMGFQNVIFDPIFWVMGPKIKKSATVRFVETIGENIFPSFKNIDSKIKAVKEFQIVMTDLIFWVT